MKKARLRDQFAHQVRNIFLAFGAECFLVAGAAAESDDHDFSLWGECCGASPCGTKQRAAKASSAAVRRKSRRVRARMWLASRAEALRRARWDCVLISMSVRSDTAFIRSHRHALYSIRSFAPFGAGYCPNLISHGLRRGLHSFAASRL